MSQHYLFILNEEKSKDSKDLQERIISSMFLTLLVLGDDRFNNFNALQKENILSILVTLIVLNDRSNSLKEEQPYNINHIFSIRSIEIHQIYWF